MSDSIGDILYIVVMVVALIFSIYKKSRANSQDGTIVPEREVGDPFDEAFPTFNRSLLEDEEPEERPLKHPPRPTQATQPEKITYQKIAYQRLEKSGSLDRPERITRISPKSNHRKSIVQKVEDYQHFFWDDEPLDLRNAIIYAEIIKRPDY